MDERTQRPGGVPPDRTVAGQDHRVLGGVDQIGRSLELLAPRLGLHRGWKEAIPPRLKTELKALRSRWLGVDGDRGKQAVNGKGERVDSTGAVASP